MWLSRCALVFTITFLLASPALKATDPINQAATIVINHSKKTYEIRNWGRRSKNYDPQKLESTQSFSLRPGEKVTVIIEDPNPFLYTYQWSPGASTSSNNAEALRTFSKSLLDLVTGLEPPKASKAGPVSSNDFRKAPAPRPKYGTVALTAFHSNDADAIGLLQESTSSYQALTEAARVNQATTSPSESSMVIEKAAETVRSNDVFTSHDPILKSILAEAGLSSQTQFFKDFKAAVGKLYLYSSDEKKILTLIESGDAKSALAIIDAWQLDTVTSDVEKDYDQLHKVRNAILAKLGAETDVRSSDQLGIVDLTGLSLRLSDNVTKILDNTRKYIKDNDAKKKPTGTLFDEDENTLKGLAASDRKRLIAAIDDLIYSYSGAINDLKERADRAKIPSPYDLRDEAEISKTLVLEAKQLGTLVTLRNSLSQIDSLTNELSHDPFYFSLVFILQQETETRAAMDSLKAFSSTALTGAKPLFLEEVSYPDATTVSHRKLTISLTKKMPEGVKANREPLDSHYSTEYSFDFQPYSAANLGIGAALIYSFTKTHKFSTTPSGQKFEIVDTQESDHTGVNVAAMLTITPTSWAQSDFHGLFEIGIKPEKDLGLYGGFGFTFYNFLHFGAGIAFEQVDQLKSGLHLHDLINTADALKTQKGFEAGFYLHMTADLKFSSKQ